MSILKYKPDEYSRLMMGMYTPEEQGAVLDYLLGHATTKQIVSHLGTSRQQLINMSTGVVRNWIDQGLLDLSGIEKTIKEELEGDTENGRD